MSTEPDHITAHRHSIRHREAILASELCGCFDCLAIFAVGEIHEWTDADSAGIGQTAVCPKCANDAVIGSASGYPNTRHFLGAMKQHWCS